MNLPDEFKDKMVEVVVKIESEIEKKLMIDTIRIDTTKWKFNRDENMDDTTHPIATELSLHYQPLCNVLETKT